MHLGIVRFFFGTVIVFALVNAATKACAESEYYRIALTQFDASPGGSVEQLEAALKLIDACSHFDLEAALIRADQATELARALKDPNGEAACFMYRALINHRMGHTERAGDALQKAESRFDPQAANAFYRCHYFSAFARNELSIGEGVRAIESFLRNSMSAALETEDDILITRCRMALTFDLVALAGEDPRSEDVVATLKQIKRVGPAVGLVHLTSAFSSYIESKVAIAKGQEDRAVRLLSTAAEEAGESGSGVAEGIYRFALVKILVKRDEWERALPHMKRGLEICRRLKSPSWLLGALAQLANGHRQLGQTEEAKSCLDEALALDAAGVDHATTWRSSLYRVAMQLAYDDVDLEKLHQYALKVSTPEFLDELVLASENFDRLQARLVELEENRDQVEQQRNVLERTYNQSQAQSQRKIRYLQLALGMAAGGLVVALLSGALFLSRRRLIATRHQLSEQIQASLKNKESYERLEKSMHRLKRMESLGSMASGVAHDFNNLLVGVICNAELIRQRTMDDSMARECVGQLIQAAEKAAGLSRQMLAYAGKQSIEKSPQDLSQLVRDLLVVLQSTVGDHVKVHVEPSAEAQLALCDATQIEQVVLNLVTNARDASPEGATVTVRTGSESIDVIDEDYLYGSRLAGGTFAYIEVQDTGRGLAPESLEHIFEPFHSDHGSGRGLGLAVVYGLIESHDGLIRVTSQPKVGMRMRVLLPIATADEVTFRSQPDSPNAAAGTADSSGPLVLVADDEPMVLAAAKSLLEAHAWEPLVVSDGREAMDQIQRNRHRICCILLDVVMPGMGAGEVLEEMNRESINIPVIIMSGFSELQMQKYREYPQVIDVFEKPFRSSEVISVLESLHSQFTRIANSD